MINEAKIIVYFALPQKAAFCCRSSPLKSYKQASLWKICGPFPQGACSPLPPKVTAKSAFCLWGSAAFHLGKAAPASTLPSLSETPFRKMKSRYLFGKRTGALGLRKSCCAIPLVAVASSVKWLLTGYLVTTRPLEASVRTALCAALDLTFLIDKMWYLEQTVPNPKYWESFIRFLKCSWMHLRKVTELWKGGSSLAGQPASALWLSVPCEPRYASVRKPSWTSSLCLKITCLELFAQPSVEWQC